jgi:hypothetical protein
MIKKDWILSPETVFGMEKLERKLTVVNFLSEVLQVEWPFLKRFRKFRKEVFNERVSFGSILFSVSAAKKVSNLCL